MKKPMKKARKATGLTAKIVKDGTKLKLVSGKSGKPFVVRANKPGVIERLIKAAKSYAVKITNLEGAKKMVAAAKATAKKAVKEVAKGAASAAPETPVAA